MKAKIINLVLGLAFTFGFTQEQDLEVKVETPYRLFGGLSNIGAHKITGALLIVCKEQLVIKDFDS